MEDKIKELLKKDIAIFLNEYADYLNKEQLEIIRDINYDKIIHFKDINIPIGLVNYNQIFLSKGILKILNNNGDSGKSLLINNKNYSSYLKVMGSNYQSYNYYADHIMFLVFKLVMCNEHSLINGFINHEVSYLREKYNIMAINVYKREEVIANRLISLLGRECCLHIMFMDCPTAFKYLNDNVGYRYAYLYYTLSEMMDKEYQQIYNNDYEGMDSLNNYAHDYDHILYGDVYNYLLDFNIQNNCL